jgi:excisionase family DNA binding protein
MENLPKPELFSVNEIADFLKVSRKTIYYWVSRNEIPYMKMGKHLRFIRERGTSVFYRQKSQNGPALLKMGGNSKQQEFRIFDNQGKNLIGPREIRYGYYRRQ